MAPRGQNRDKLVEAMRDLALRQGYWATGVDQVCAAVDVSKGAFYHHFASKEDLALAAIESYFDELAAALLPEAVEAGGGDPTARLEAFLANARDVCTGPVAVNGCLLGIMSLETAESHPRLRADIARRFDQLASPVSDLISAAAASRRRALPADALARQFLAVLEGAIVLAKADDDPGRVASAIDLYADHLHLLLEGDAR